MTTPSTPQYQAVYQWLEAQHWLVLQYTPADLVKGFGAVLYALSPAGTEWRFHFNTHNELSGWDDESVVRVTS